MKAASTNPKLGLLIAWYGPLDIEMPAREDFPMGFRFECRIVNGVTG